ncbi:MAG TPA: dehydrogenase, partial [Hellea balneolensis]|nr:dehydrogenase [Hellea balneolensis]
MRRLRKTGFLTIVLVAGLFSLSACSTLSKVNPFGGKDEVSEVKVDPDRISILTLDDKLEVSGAIAPSDIILPDAYTNPDWPQTGGYATHSVQRTDAPGPLRKVWSRSVGKGSFRKGRLTASPVVADGRIYTLDAANKVTALDAQTGERVWSKKITVKSRGKTRRGKRKLVERIKDPLTFRDRGGKDTESIGGGVALADGRLYVSSGLGVVLALDAQTGKEIWRKRTFSPIQSAPTVADGRVFVISDDNELYAIDADTGEVEWTYQAIIEMARMLTSPAPAVIEDVVIAPFSSGEVVALKVQNGGVLWQDSLNASRQLTPLATLNDIASGPVIADGYVFVTGQSGEFAAFDFRTGQQVWSQPAGSLGFPLVVGDYIYTVTTEGQVVCMTKADGTVAWLTQLPVFKKAKKRKKRISWAGPVMAGDRLLLMSSRGRAVELNPWSGKIIREFKLAGPVFISPIVANN